MVLANRTPSECVLMQSGDDVKSVPTCLVEPMKVRVDETLQQTCVGGGSSLHILTAWFSPTRWYHFWLIFASSPTTSFIFYRTWSVGFFETFCNHTESLNMTFDLKNSKACRWSWKTYLLLPAFQLFFFAVPECQFMVCIFNFCSSLSSNLSLTQTYLPDWQRWRA